MRQYWLSNEKMTVRVVADPKGTIVAAAPITRRFIGQPLHNLEKWMGVAAVDVTTLENMR